MRTIPGGMAALLGPNASRELYSADLFRITLKDGTVLRYTNFGMSLTVSAETFLTGPPIFEISGLSLGIGIATTELKLTVKGDLTTLVDGVPILQAIAGGLFGGATFVQFKAIMSAAGDTSPGVLTWFTGKIATVDSVSAGIATLTVRSSLEVLGTQVPVRVFMPSCPWTWGDAGCGVNRATYKFTSTVQTGSTVNKVVTTSAAADGDFTLGVINFTSGPNKGQTRSVRVYASGTMYLSVALPNAPTAGDTFDSWPGCDKTQTRCSSRFVNIARYGGTDYVPQPEAAF